MIQARCWCKETYKYFKVFIAYLKLWNISIRRSFISLDCFGKNLKWSSKLLKCKNIENFRNLVASIGCTNLVFEPEEQVFLGKLFKWWNFDTFQISTQFEPARKKTVCNVSEQKKRCGRLVCFRKGSSPRKTSWKKNSFFKKHSRIFLAFS